ncbi:MAG: hypothetical protein DWQ31_16045 [Planctomycetota bacterium]|nr:MAG: hypothetical protein DWQ31_16045 [Planctomycetota bacterium]REJ89098.1 MAG: hypothetical protein DWQ35_18720 [Planctomycetota bacterium]
MFLLILVLCLVNVAGGYALARYLAQTPVEEGELEIRKSGGSLSNVFQDDRESAASDDHSAGAKNDATSGPMASVGQSDTGQADTGQSEASNAAKGEHEDAIAVFKAQLASQAVGE